MGQTPNFTLRTKRSNRQTFKRGRNRFLKISFLADIKKMV